MADEVVTCPRGHVVPASDVTVVDGRRVCPRCDEEGGWQPAKQPLRWSRRLLAAPVGLVALAFLAGGISDTFELVAYSDGSAPGKLQAAVAISLVADVVFLVAAAWVAVVLYRAE